MAGTVRSRSLRSEEGDQGDEKGQTMTAQPRKMSEIMKEMSEILLRHPSEVPSSEAALSRFFFANAAWNESIGVRSFQRQLPQRLGNDRSRESRTLERVQIEWA